MNGHIAPMYNMKPVFELSSDIHVKTTMYGMKNLQGSPVRETKSTECVLPDRDVLIREIESKQAEILKALADIRAQMASLKEQLCKDIDTKTSVGPHNQVTPSKKIDFSQYGIIHEVVVNANVQKPPYSLLAMSRLWNGKINVQLSCHTHSSLTTLPENLAQFSQSVDNSRPTNNNAAELKVRLVWKEMEADCEFIVSPFKFMPLLGEVNMLRFLNRVMSANEGLAASLEESTLKDGCLDACQLLKNATTGKDVHAAVKSIAEELGETRNWFGGGSPDVVDLAAWSAIKSAQNPKLSKSLASWFQRSEQLFSTHR